MARSSQPSRRTFLSRAASGAALLGCAGADSLGMFAGLPRVSAQEASLPKIVPLRAEIEPLVRLLEETPREKVFEAFAERIRGGTSYREVVAALLLAGIRNVEPRPSVGFKFHAVLAVNAAHQSSLAGPDADRWLPIFWALDGFKSAQAADVKERNWTMAPVNEAGLPTAGRARQAFVEAMENWDEAGADVAVSALARSGGLDDTFELLYRFGSRDFRSIGHKAIYVAGARRLLDVIGREHAEPVLRSLAYALLNHEGENPAKRDDEADRDGRKNLELAGGLAATWQDGKPSDEAVRELLAALRQGSSEEVCRLIVEQLGRGVSPDSVWDGLFAGSSELLMRQPGIVGLHTLTTTNAIHYAYRTAADDKMRRWLLLQNAAFLPRFRAAMHARGKVGDARIDQLEPLAPEAAGAEGVREIFADMSRDKALASRKLLGYLAGMGPVRNDGPQAKLDTSSTTSRAEQVMDAARVLVFLKGRDAHDYKFSSAVLEDYVAMSPAWRDRLLAASSFQLVGSGASDNGLVPRTRAALKG